MQFKHVTLDFDGPVAPESIVVAREEEGTQ